MRHNTSAFDPGGPAPRLAGTAAVSCSRTVRLSLCGRAQRGRAGFHGRCPDQLSSLVERLARLGCTRIGSPGIFQ
jgi:hypothetical protein